MLLRETAVTSGLSRISEICSTTKASPPQAELGLHINHQGVLLSPSEFIAEYEGNSCCVKM